MKNLKVLVTIALFLSSSLAYGKPKAYVDAKDSFFTEPVLTVDGTKVRNGFWGLSNLPEAFAKDPLAKALAEDHVLYRNWGHGSFLGGLALSLGYLAHTRSTPSDDFNSDYYWGLFAIGLITGGIFQIRSQTKLIRAINQYNGVYDQEEASWEVTPATSGLGLALHF